MNRYEEFEFEAERLRLQRRSELDRHLASIDESFARQASAYMRFVAELIQLAKAGDIPHSPDWIADNIMAPLDDMAESYRRSIKTLREIIGIVERFDPPPARVPDE